jgi:alpha-methylacyl-CoA racemase
LGPLAGFRIVEIAGIGPGQLCGMLLADMGADVLRITRLGAADTGLGIPPRFDLMNRGRPALPVDLKRPDGVELVLRLCEEADALFEGFRPGVMERLGLGPTDCMRRNPRLVYGRMTGWGQEGPLAHEAGHDANYLALAGALGAIGERDGPPVLPLNLVADFGGGGLYLALGLLAALLETSRSGRGQVVDAAMVDGVASMTTLFHGLMAAGYWREGRGSNVLDGGATRDGGFVAVAALERRFYRNLLDVLELRGIDPEGQFDTRLWPQTTRSIADAFLTRSRDEWAAAFAGREACVTPVLSLAEATRHPHNVARGTYVEVEGVTQPGPAPRFSRTPGSVAGGPREPGVDASGALAAWGVEADELRRLADAGVVRVR